MINCIKREDAKTTKAYLRTDKKNKQAKREAEKDLKIYERLKISYKEYFENLSHQVMSPSRL